MAKAKANKPRRRVNKSKRRADAYTNEELAAMQETIASADERGGEDRTFYQRMIDALATVTQKKRRG
jgi:hypothetical protein